MKRYTFAVLTALALVPSSGVGRASAQVFLPGGQQPVNPYQRPTVSPYINMFQGGNPALNYYGLVRPQLQTAKSIQKLQMQQQTLPQMGQPFAPLGNGTGFSLPNTGHATAFMNYSTYFPSSNGGGTGSSSALGGSRRR